MSKWIGRGTAIRQKKDSSPERGVINWIRVRGAAGEGTVIGARCSPANHLTQFCFECIGRDEYQGPIIDSLEKYIASEDLESPTSELNHANVGLSLAVKRPE